ncbi:MAG: leucine-rich repeat protein [Butyrivibrio sp.]|nr:leucine-rich repeat protein [Butyrivibrio sp.]
MILSARNKNRIHKGAKIAAVLISFALAASVTVDAEATGLTEINAMTFRKDPDVTTVHIGSDVTSITSDAFKGLFKLRSITVSEKNPFYSSFSDCLYNKNKTELLCFPPALSGAEIPASVTSIGENALCGVGPELKAQIKSVIESQAGGSLTEDKIPGEHFVHTQYGVKWKDSKGNIVEPYSDIMRLTASVVEACTDGTMTQNKQLERCFNYFINEVSYERETDVPRGDWTSDYARQILLSGKGNCYKYAAAFGYIARGLGFDTKVCCGTVASAKGGTTPHAWTEVKIKDKWYIFDTEMQDAKGNGYYKQTYDKYPAGPIEKMAVWTIHY